MYAACVILIMKGTLEISFHPLKRWFPTGEGLAPWDMFKNHMGNKRRPVVNFTWDDSTALFATKASEKTVPPGKILIFCSGCPQEASMTIIIITIMNYCSYKTRITLI